MKQTGEFGRRRPERVWLSSVPILGPALLAVVVATDCAPRQTSATRVLAVVDEYWASYIDRYPEIATYNGVAKAPHDRLTDNSLDAVARWQRREDMWLRILQDAKGG